MFKKLLTFVAAVCVALGAKAQSQVLYEDANPTVNEGWYEFLAYTADEATDLFGVGDVIKVTVTDAGSEGWPQVLLSGPGWDPYTNYGVGGQTYPVVCEFAVTAELYAKFQEKGVCVRSESAAVSKIELEKSVYEVGPFTVWFGNKECGWGNGVGLSASLFADVEANGQLIFWTSDQSFQVLLGGWSGLNLPAYAAGNIENMEYVDGVTTVTLIEEYETTNEYDQDGTMKEFNVFELMKANGVVMHGTTTITRIDYIPGKYINEYNADVEKVNELANAYQEFVSEVAETFPGYAVLKADEIAALTAQIEALNDKIATAWEAFAETGVYEGLGAEETKAATEALMALIAGQEEVAKAIQDEYDADIENLNEITTALQEFNTQVEENFPGYGVLHADEITALTAQIEALNTQIADALAAAYETGVYAGPTAEEMKAATDAFMALNTGYDDALNAITAASEEDQATINELVTALQEIIALADEFPGIANLYADDFTACNAQIEALNNQLIAALEEAFETGEYNGIAQADVVAATEAIMSLAAEVDATIENLDEAINEDYAILEELSDTLGAIIDDEEFPAFLYAYGDEIGAAADALNTVNDAFLTAYMTALYETGVYEGPSQEDITAATEAVMGVVTARAEALAAIENGAEEDMNTINAYYEQIIGVLDAEGNEDTASYQIAQLMNERLAELKEAVIAAQAEALNETAEYVSPITDADTAYLEGLAQAFQTTSIYGIGLDANGAIYFDLNGNMTQNPVAGKVYIKIAEGKATKTLVK